MKESKHGFLLGIIAVVVFIVFTSVTLARKLQKKDYSDENL